MRCGMLVREPCLQPDAVHCALPCSAHITNALLLLQVGTAINY